MYDKRMGFLTDTFTDMLTNPGAVLAGERTISERKNEQWQIANSGLDAAAALMTVDEPDYQAVIATALVGLLALQLSKS